jgi:hypothetical protein
MRESMFFGEAPDFVEILRGGGRRIRATVQCRRRFRAVTALHPDPVAGFLSAGTIPTVA